MDWIDNVTFTQFFLSSIAGISIGIVIVMGIGIVCIVLGIVVKNLIGCGHQSRPALWGSSVHLFRKI